MNKKFTAIRLMTQLLIPILLLSAGYEYVSSAPNKDWAAPVLPDENCLQRWGQLDTTQKVKSWPKYLYNKTYGWFDTTHFATGNPRQIIADVGTAVANGGGVITITQGLHNGITGYTGHYQVSGQVSEQQIIDVAFGIYTDWSWRFENWEGDFPRVLLSPYTRFAIEDLPSQYIGFFAAAHDLTYQQVFACYLGGVKVVHDEPPHIVIDNNPIDPDLLPEVRRLENETFEPLVETESGWQHRPWSMMMRITAVPDSAQTWHFLHEETWYFGQ